MCGWKSPRKEKVMLTEGGREAWGAGSLEGWIPDAHRNQKENAY